MKTVIKYSRHAHSYFSTRNLYACQRLCVTFYTVSALVCGCVSACMVASAFIVCNASYMYAITRYASLTLDQYILSLTHIPS